MATASGEIHGTENGEEPMETDYSPVTEQPAPLPVTTAPLWISVDFLTEDRPTKIKIQKMLQSFCNKEIQCEISTMQLVEEGTQHYELQISPPFAVTRLLEKRSLELEKDKIKVRVHFSASRSQPGAPPQSPATTPIQEQIPVRVTVQADLTGLGAQAAERFLLSYGKGSPSPREFTMTGSFEEVAKFHRAFCECLPNSQRAPREPEGAESGPASAPLGVVNGDPGPSAADTAEPGVPGSKAPIPVPLLHFDYISKAYKDEIQKIERENNVAITPHVSVSIDPAGGSEGKATVERAEKEFISLFQDVVSHVSCVQIPQPSLDHVAEAQREEARLVLSVSAKGCQVIGPARSLAKARMGGGAASFRSGVESVPELEIKSQDPLVDQGLEINKAYFHFIRCLFTNQVVAIQQKFGVIIRAQDLDDSVMTVKVKVEPGEGRANLQSHALRAFIQLYQKVATKIMGCTLQDPKDTEKAKTVFREICDRHPLVIDVEAPGPWKLIGFPEHLSPVVKEIEAKLGGPVFSEGARLRSGPLGSGPSARPEGATGGQDHSTEDQEDTCPICMDSFHSPETLKCKHRFCKECLEKSVEAMGPICPVCKDVFGQVEGNQPDGSMFWLVHPFPLPGYPGFSTIEIRYSIPSGRQTDKHPNPGRLFHGAQRTAYLPDTPEGREVLSLLKKAFDQKLIFTVGTSRTTGAVDVVTWNDIHHKTNTDGGPQAFGYPDPDYLKRVKEELKDKGVQ